MPDIFTHTFEMYFGEGDQWLIGKVEFNADGKVSYHIEDSCIPMKEETLKQFLKMMDHMKETFQLLGGLKKCEVKEIQP